MSASHASALDAIAFQLVAALENYEAAVERMLAGWPDLEGYREVSDRVEKIRLYSSALPDLRVQWVEVLISHAELVHFLWRMQYADRDAARAQIGGVREQHGHAVRALRERCMRGIQRSRHNAG